MQAECTHDRLSSITVAPTLQICKRLFADDMGILIPADAGSFQEVEDCLQLYEKALGAKLNLPKSSISPIGLTDIPQWLLDKGCKILAPGVILRHLGASAGYQVSLPSLLNYSLDRVHDSIACWKEHHILFASKLILIKQVLLAIPVFHMMTIHFTKAASLQLQRMCKDFLWGFNSSGRRKFPLVPWERIARPRMQGWLDIRLPYYHGTLLLAR